ncbi:MAG: hypothetical protein ACR2PY_07750, partial [Salinispira sp.]
DNPMIPDSPGQDVTGKTLSMQKFIETILVQGNEHIPLLEEHYARYLSTVNRAESPSTGRPEKPPLTIQDFAQLLIASVDTAMPRAHAAAQAAAHAGMTIPPEQHTWRCRMIYEGNGKISSITAEPFTPRTLKTIGIIDIPTACYPLKYSDRRVFDDLRKRFPRCDEIIITKNGFLSDGTFTNVYLRSPDNILLTPNTHLLAGCRRERLIRDGLLHPRTLHWRDIKPGWLIGFINALNPPGQLGEFSSVQIVGLPVDSNS